MTNLIPSPGGTTAAWFTTLLVDKGLLADDNEVVKISQRPVGNGLVGESVRFELTYRTPADGAPSSVVCKYPAADPAYRAAGVSEMLYARETLFYQEIAGTVDVRAPRTIHASYDSTSHDFILVLEDLSPAVGGDQVEGCTVDQAEVVVEAAAALHAPAWNDPMLDSAEWNVRSTWIPRIEEAYPGLFEQFKVAFAGRSSARELAIGDRFAPIIGQWFAEQPRPWTITHGDFRLDNMLFGIVGGSEPVGVLDWQTLLPAPGTSDLAYFIGGCLPTDVRRKCEHDLLQRYHDALIAKGVQDYSFEKCMLDYRYHTLMGYFMCTYAAMLVPRTERGDAMFSIWLERVVDHIEDHDAMSLLPAPTTLDVV